MNPVSFSSSDTDSRHGMDAVVCCCPGNHCFNHGLSGQTSEVRVLREAGVNSPILLCQRWGIHMQPFLHLVQLCTDTALGL